MTNRTSLASFTYKTFIINFGHTKNPLLQIYITQHYTFIQHDLAYKITKIFRYSLVGLSGRHFVSVNNMANFD